MTLAASLDFGASTATAHQPTAHVFRSALPATVTVTALVDGMAVTLRTTDSDWLATDDGTDMYGEGPDIRSAVADLLDSLEFLRADLASHRGELSGRLERQLAVLDSRSRG